MLELTRPLVVFDIESTGTNPSRDRIVELAVMKIFPDGKIQNTVRRLYPEMPIPAAATEVHHITDEDVKDCPPFSCIADKLYNYLEDCDLAGYNILGFDIPMLEAEFKRAGFTFKMDNRRVIDAYHIFCKLYPRNLTAAYKFFCGKDLEGAHGAMADTAATWEVLLGELNMHPEIPRDLDELSEYCSPAGADTVDRTRRFKWSGDDVVLNFGKNSGRTLKDLAANDPGFLRWIINNDFSDEVKEIAQNALMGKFPIRKGTAKNESGEG